MTTITKVNWDNVQKLFWNRSDPLSLSLSLLLLLLRFHTNKPSFLGEVFFLKKKNPEIDDNSLTEKPFVKISYGRTTNNLLNQLWWGALWVDLGLILYRIHTMFVNWNNSIIIYKLNYVYYEI